MSRVRGGCAGWAAGVLRVYVDGWLALAGFGRTGRCRVASWVRDGSRALWWCLGDLWMETGGACGARSGLVDVWVMHGMVMDETLHVFPGGRVGELFRVC